MYIIFLRVHVWRAMHANVASKSDSSRTCICGLDSIVASIKCSGTIATLLRTRKWDCFTSVMRKAGGGWAKAPDVRLISAPTLIKLEKDGCDTVEDLQDICVKTARIFSLDSLQSRLVLEARASIVNNDVRWPQLFLCHFHLDIPVGSLANTHILEDDSSLISWDTPAA